MDPPTERPPSLLRSRPLWLGIIATVLYLGPFCFVLSILFHWVGELPDTYIWNTGAGSLASLLDFVGTPLIVWLSEPERLGRRLAYLVLCFCATLTIFACWLSGGGITGAYVYLGLRVVLSVIGGGNPQGANYTILCAMFAERAPKEQHVGGFSILLGAQFLTFVLGPGLAIGLKPVIGENGLLLSAFVLACLQFPFVMIFFPRSLPRPQVALAADPVESAAAGSGVSLGSGALSDIGKALRWIFTQRTAVVVVWISINFVGAADSSNIALFLTSSLHFDESKVNVIIGATGFFGLIVSLFLVPWMANCMSKGSIVFISALSTVGHCLVYGILTTIGPLTALSFLGSITYAGMPALLGYMDADNSAGISQGVLLGTFSGLKSIAALAGPPLLAACLQAYKDGHAICYIVPIRNFVGSGFVVCALVMVPGVIASCRLLQQGSREKRGRDLQDVSVSIPVVACAAQA